MDENCNDSSGHDGKGGMERMVLDYVICIGVIVLIIRESEH